MLALLATLVTAASAHADDSGEAAFHDAEQQLARGDQGAIAAFEAVGEAHPDSAWADDAWLEAGRAAGRALAGTHATAGLVRALVRHDELAEARDEISTIEQPAVARELHAALERAELRRDVRWTVVGMLAALAVAAALALRRASGS